MKKIEFPLNGAGWLWAGRQNVPGGEIRFIIARQSFQFFPWIHIFSDY
jgi:hypothetical protein